MDNWRCGALPHAPAGVAGPRPFVLPTPPARLRRALQYGGGYAEKNHPPKPPNVHFVSFAGLCVLAVEGLSLRACTAGAAQRCATASPVALVARSVLCSLFSVFCSLEAATTP